MHPSAMLSTRSTSPPKSECPYKVEYIFLAILSLIYNTDCLSFYSYTTLSLKVVRVKHLPTVILSVAEQLTCQHHLVYQRCLSMIDMGNNRNVSNVLHNFP